MVMRARMPILISDKLDFNSKGKKSYKTKRTLYINDSFNRTRYNIIKKPQNIQSKD